MNPKCLINDLGYLCTLSELYICNKDERKLHNSNKSKRTIKQKQLVLKSYLTLNYNWLNKKKIVRVLTVKNENTRPRTKNNFILSLGHPNFPQRWVCKCHFQVPWKSWFFRFRVPGSFGAHSHFASHADMWYVEACNFTKINTPPSWNILGPSWNIVSHPHFSPWKKERKVPSTSITIGLLSSCKKSEKSGKLNIWAFLIEPYFSSKRGAVKFHSHKTFVMSWFLLTLWLGKFWTFLTNIWLFRSFLKTRLSRFSSLILFCQFLETSLWKDIWTERHYSMDHSR